MALSGADVSQLLQPLAISNPPPPPPMEADPSVQGQGAGGHWPDHHPFQTALQQAEAARLGMSYDSNRRHSAAEIFELIRAPGDTKPKSGPRALRLA